MSDQEILPCVVCGQQHEQMLMLVCMDDPCINCAAIHFCTTQLPNSNVYSCGKCGEATQLDASSIIELQRVYAQLKGKKRFDYRRAQGSITESDKYQRPNQASRRQKTNKVQFEQTKDMYEPPSTSQTYQQHPYVPISQPTNPTNPYNNIVVTKAQQHFYMCQTHPEEELSYFCFNCNGPICPQCAIHGSHREHEVLTTRKAIKTIKANLQKCQEQVTKEMNSVGNIVDSYKNKLKQMSGQVKKQKESIKQVFNQLRSILNQKQKEFQRSIDTTYESNCNIIRNQTASYDRISEQHALAKKNIDATMKKDDLTILQQYSKRQKQANVSVDNSRNKRYNPDLQGMKEIDHNLFRDQIDQLSGIMSGLRLTIQPRKRN